MARPMASNVISAYYDVSDSDLKRYMENDIPPPKNEKTYINPNFKPTTQTPTTTQANQQANLQRTNPQQQLIDVQKQQAIRGLKDTYESQRSGLRADSTMQAKDFENFLANKGISSSGSAGQGEIARNVALQGATSASKLQQQKSIEGVEAQALQNKFIEQQRLSDIAREDARYREGLEREDTRYQDTLSRQNESTQFNQLQNSKSEYADTVNRFYENYQAEINKVQNDGDPSNDWQISILQSARQQKIQELAQIEAAQKAAEEKQRATAEQQAFENALKLQKQQYDINKPYYKPTSGGNSKSEFGLDW